MVLSSNFPSRFKFIVPVLARHMGIQFVMNFKQGLWNGAHSLSKKGHSSFQSVVTVNDAAIVNVHSVKGSCRTKVANISSGLAERNGIFSTFGFSATANKAKSHRYPSVRQKTSKYDLVGQNGFAFSKLLCSEGLMLTQARRMIHCTLKPPSKSSTFMSHWKLHRNSQLELAYPALLSCQNNLQCQLVVSSVMTVVRRHYPASIQKNVSSALAVKRPTRKKPKAVEGDDVDKVVAYGVADELNLGQLKDALRKQGLYDVCELPVDAQDVLFVQAKYPVDEKKREIFFFSDGSAVFWSLPEVERKEIVKFLRKHDYRRYPSDHVKLETEEMDVKVSQGPTSSTGDTLHLSDNLDEVQVALEKYAFSNALAQSVKLSVWESALDHLIDSMEVVVEDLRNDQMIRMSRQEVLRHTGELFALRHLINLSSDLLDTPDFYWDRPALETLYLGVYNHLDIARRTKVMNEKLSYCVELTELLSRNLNDAHHTRLEVMIIILIMVEVIFEIVHYLERFIGA